MNLRLEDFLYLCAMNQNHIENKTHLLQYAMHAGIFLGGFWVLSYLLIIIGHDNLILMSLRSVLRIGTPLLLFYFLRNYNEKFLKNTMRFWSGVQFSMILFFFGSILEAFIVLIHVKWIDPNFITTMYEVAMQTVQTLNFGTRINSQIVEQAQQAPPTPFLYVFRTVFIFNALVGFLLSLIIVPIAQRFKIVENKQ